MQIIWLFVMALPIACIAWTVTHEEIFRELQDWARERSENSPSRFMRKFAYPWQCEYCFSHYVAAVFLAITGYKLLFDDWRGYLIGGFALVWIANQYMSLYAMWKLDIRRERVEIKGVQAEVEEKTKNMGDKSRKAA